MNFKKPIKIIAGLVVFFTLPSLLFFGFLYLRYNEELPSGIQGKEADALAIKMMQSLNYEAYENTNYLEWTFKNRHHFKWQKDENICNVYWKEFKVELYFEDVSKSKVYIHGFNAVGEQAQELIDKAIAYFNNDSFWLVAPYKLYDEGAERRLVKLDNGSQALLVTYTKDGTTPGDSFLWILGDDGKPKSFKMWTSLLPIDGLEATWEDWITTESGAQLPTFHKLLFIGIKLTDIKGSK